MEITRVCVRAKRIHMCAADMCYCVRVKHVDHNIFFLSLNECLYITRWWVPFCVCACVWLCIFIWMFIKIDMFNVLHIFISISSVDHIHINRSHMKLKRNLFFSSFLFFFIYWKCIINQIKLWSNVWMCMVNIVHLS